MSNLLETGKIVNTHGVRGEVKIQPWANTPDFLLEFDTMYIAGTPYRVLSARVHGTCVLAMLDGVDNLDAANRLRGSVVSIDKTLVELEEGEFFVADLIGLTAFDAQSGAELGRIVEVLQPPSSDVYVIKGEREILVPAVPEFVEEIDMDNRVIRVRLIEGM